jgi:hypothetical protein
LADPQCHFRTHAAPTVEQLKAGVQVAENLLVNVYILRRIADKLPKKT